MQSNLQIYQDSPSPMSKRRTDDSHEALSQADHSQIIIQPKCTLESFHLTGDLLQTELTQPAVLNNLATNEHNSTLSHNADPRTKPLTTEKQRLVYCNGTHSESGRSSSSSLLPVYIEQHT